MQPHPEEIFSALKSGSRAALARAITLVESTAPAHKDAARALLNLSLAEKKDTVRIGITGVPGAGKSTFIDTFGKLLVDKGHKVAVLAVDPTSSRTGGSILGDKTRMEKLTQEENAFIRPSPAGSTLGGVARATRESITLCEAAGYDVIILETVGVGQSETVAHSMVDFFLLLMIPGAGDELQGIKRGIMELADAVIINKAEGDNFKKAKAAQAEYAHALHLFPPPPSGWHPVTEICSAQTGMNIEKVWEVIEKYLAIVKPSGFLEQKRKTQLVSAFEEAMGFMLQDVLANSAKTKEELTVLREEVARGDVSPYVAAERVVNLLLH